MRSDEVLDQLDRLLSEAKPVPLTDQVRVKKDEVRSLLQELREAVAAERGWKG
jgi:hypothetical protein